MAFRKFPVTNSIDKKSQIWSDYALSALCASLAFHSTNLSPSNSFLATDIQSDIHKPNQISSIL